MNLSSFLASLIEGPVRSRTFASLALAILLYVSAAFGVVPVDLDDDTKDLLGIIVVSLVGGASLSGTTGTKPIADDSEKGW